jgi:hypothetical protein
MSPQLDKMGVLTVWVYFADHRRPHVQVRGPGIRANIDIDTGEVLAGHLPVKTHRQFREWLAPRRTALLAAFHSALEHEATDTILSSYREATRDL